MDVTEKRISYTTDTILIWAELKFILVITHLPMDITWKYLYYYDLEIGYTTHTCCVLLLSIWRKNFISFAIFPKIYDFSFCNFYIKKNYLRINSSLFLKMIKKKKNRNFVELLRNRNIHHRAQKKNVLSRFYLNTLKWSRWNWIPNSICGPGLSLRRKFYNFLLL